jgi:hypothetical protein
MSTLEDKDRLRDVVAKLLPDADVFWQSKGDPLDLEDCELVAVSKFDPMKRVALCYKAGIGDWPTATLADDFVRHLGPALKES